MAANEQTQYQVRRSIPTSDGTTVPYNLDRFGNLGTKDWIADLVMQGFVWSFATPGAGPASGSGHTGLTGGGNGTTIDGDQPDFIIANASTDWVMIPIELRIHGVTLDIDADGEHGDALWCTDITTTYTTATATGITPVNLLGVKTNMGPNSIPSTIYAACVVTADITDPVINDYFVSSSTQAADTGTAASEKDDHIDAVWLARYPYIMKGPSTILGYWGGTAAVTAVASAKVAIVPSAWFSQ